MKEGALIKEALTKMKIWICEVFFIDPQTKSPPMDIKIGIMSIYTIILIF